MTAVVEGSRPRVRIRRAGFGCRGRLVLVAVVYFAAAKGGLELAYANSSVTAVWAPTGIALAVLVLGGYRLWPGIALGAVLANAWTGVPLGTVAGIATGNTLEALAGAYLLLRLARFRPSLERIRDVLALVVLAAGLSTMISATIGVASLQLGSVLEPGTLASTWRTWWLGDMGGDLLIAPFLFVLAHQLRSVEPQRRVEAATLLAVVVAAGCLAFSSSEARAYLIFPVHTWVTLRFRQAGAAVASLVIAVIAVAFTAHEIGPFVKPSPDASLLLTQTFVGVAAIAALVLAAAMSERRHAEQALKAAHDELEAKVSEQTAALRRAVAQLELQGEITKNMAEGVVLVRTGDLTIVYANHKFEQMFGYEPGELEGLPVEVVNAPTESDPHEVAADIQGALARSGMWTGEVHNIRKDGQTFWCTANVTNFDHPELGEVSVAVHTDVTERRRMREELERSNAELQQFAYLASHDLHEPLRVVSQLVRLLQRRYDGQLDDQADEIIHMTVDGVDRMQRMIDALLEFARIGNSWAPTDAIDCQHAVREVQDGLRELLVDRQAELLVGRLPTVPGEPTLIGQLFQNLIANAIQYGHPDHPIVTVDAEQIGPDWHFSVTDNGDGIPPAHREQVFEMFKRLHGRDQAGSGIGLAICRRIVEAHGGRIWVQATDTGGSAFCFTLPDAAPTAPLMPQLRATVRG